MSCGAFTEIQFVMNELIPMDLDGARILDVGSGFGFFGWVLRAHRQGTQHITGIEIEPGRIGRAYEVGMYDELLQVDVRTWEPMDEYDLIVISHLIEHLSKEEGIKLIEKLKKVAKGPIIITAPHGDSRDTLGPDDPPDDQHISIWVEDDLKRLGFKTRHMRFSHRAGRVVSLFERLYFWVKRVNRGGVLVGWWSRARDRRDQA